MVFPRSTLNRIAQVYENPVVAVDVEGTQIEITKRELFKELQIDETLPRPPITHTFFVLRTEPTLAVVSMRFGSHYDMVYQMMKKNGRLKDAIASRDLMTEPVRLWTPTEHWKDLPIPRVER